MYITYACRFPQLTGLIRHLEKEHALPSQSAIILSATVLNSNHGSLQRRNGVRPTTYRPLQPNLLVNPHTPTFTATGQGFTRPRVKVKGWQSHRGHAK